MTSRSTPSPPPARTAQPAAPEPLEPAVAQALAELITTVADAVYVVDSDGRVAYANPAALAILGYAEHPGELLGQPSHRLIHHSRPDGTPFPEAACPLLAPRVTGETVRIEDDHFIRRDGAFVPVAYSSAPLATGLDHGAVVVFRDTTQLRRAEAAARHAAVEQARAEELHASRARILAAADDERRRLSRDLHDGAQQHLVNVLLSLQLSQSQADGSRRAQLLEQAVAETRNAIGELRSLTTGLAPAILTNRGLVAAIEARATTAPLPVRVSADTPEPDPRLERGVESAAYFFTVEALTNIAKHADASEASVHIQVASDQLTVTVGDNGRGGADPNRGSGINGLDDRLQALNGSLVLTSPPDGGTRLTATLPLGSPSGLSRPTAV
jgi:PAS domain S-box-containing protein